MANASNQPAADIPPKCSDGRPIIGWREFVALPDWGIDRVRVKTDTGARTSAIHVTDYEELEDGTARFDVVISERPKRRTVHVRAPLVREAVVKPSSGKRQHRPVVKTTLRLGGIEKQIEITLVCRKGMLCRMLLGRTSASGTTSSLMRRKKAISSAHMRRKKSKKKKKKHKAVVPTKKES